MAAQGPGTIHSADTHLGRLLATDLGEPYFRSFIRDVQELIHPPKLPPLEVTSKPIPTQEIWGLYAGQGKSAGARSIAVHGVVIGLLVLVGSIYGSSACFLKLSGNAALDRQVLSSG
jgi:hypothetical protein